MSEEAVKFTEEELKEVKEIQQSYFNTQNQFGQIKLAKLRLEEQLSVLTQNEDEIHKAFVDTQSKEKEFLDGITKKYGEGSLNPETGEFTPNK
tara:strand:- start:1328 stop:1606 length:279 start_codon:yes stop_codon:yes gene_type:complete